MKYSSIALLAVTACLSLLLSKDMPAPAPTPPPSVNTATKSSPSRPRSKSTKKRATKLKCIGCARDAHGRIARSTTAKHTFQQQHPCPATGRKTGACPGYVIDHVIALKRGGPDAPSNMQWQTRAEAKAKDKWE